MLALVAGGALAAPKYPVLTGRVVDGAGVIPAAVRDQLTARLAGLERANGRQLVVATVADLGGYDINEYGVGLGRAWGIGQKGFNTGAILLVALKERRVTVLTGQGVQGVLTDALSGQIIREQIKPRFKAGDLPGGIVAGTDALVAQLSRPLDDARDVAAAAAAAEVRKRAQAERPQPSRGEGGGGAIFWIVVVLAFLILPRLFGGRRRGLAGGGWGAQGGAAGGLLNALPWILMANNARGGWGGGGGSGWGGGGGSSGGGDSFSGGGGSFDGGGASDSW